MSLTLILSFLRSSPTNLLALVTGAQCFPFPVGLCPCDCGKQAALKLSSEGISNFRKTHIINLHVIKIDKHIPDDKHWQYRWKL